jgi:hypothetical protein
MIGCDILARYLAQKNVKYTYGINDRLCCYWRITIIELGFAIQGVGINYDGLRNEQEATMLVYWILNWMPVFGRVFQDLGIRMLLVGY